MVFWFTSSDNHILYMGKDKFENEELIKYGWEEDVWFHVDDLSSAHVYLRLKQDETWQNINEQLIMECCQLVKENSIQGKKKDKVDVVYTPWTNLHKTNNMEVGAIGFHDENNKRKVKNITRDKDIVKALVKTQVENFPNFQELKEKHILEEKRERFKQFKEQQKVEKEEQKQRAIEKELMNYDHMMDKDKMVSNKNVSLDDDDFI